MNNHPKAYKNLLFDLDNTLVDCSIYYVECQEKFATFSHERLGVTRELALRVLKDIDVACTTLEHGFSRIRFPRSFEAASAALDIITGHPIDTDAAAQAHMLGDSVFDAPYPVYDGVIDMLEELQHDFNLFVVTKGDFKVQLRKLQINGLDKYFTKDRQYIISKKTAETYKQVVEDHNLTPSETLVIGDSLKDDIGSGLRAGLDTAWVRAGANLGWAYENEQNEPTYIVEQVTDLPSIVCAHI
jgi:HAD superfamily hydrolase (TIGR01549 family)